MSEEPLSPASEVPTADDPTQDAPRRIPPHDTTTLKLCVASAWLHSSISASRAHELADALACTPGEIEALKDAEDQEARADD